ncbi:MAG: hypothetical protein HOJ07_03930 [Rhodospirillaceae bacterium]|jgi:hypothetical protein|nr:hypothetical protein [Rhodospirillaceae bacterium]MBT5674813.1 hypothetical protein [Rhodospirillaceae bacterium]
MSDTKTLEGTSRRALLIGAAGLTGIAATLVAKPAVAESPRGRSSMDTAITDMIHAEDHGILTERARGLTKAELVELGRLSRGDTKIAGNNTYGLTGEDLDSIEEAFWMVDARDHNLDHASLLPDGGGLVDSAAAGSSMCCCCCAASAPGSANLDRPRIA